jgi:hypothetical protein
MSVIIAYRHNKRVEMLKNIYKGMSTSNILYYVFLTDFETVYRR